MKELYVYFVCLLYGYLIRTKEIHWSTDSNSTHKLCDEIYDGLDDFMDRFAEASQGVTGTHFKSESIKPVLPNSTELIPMLKELNEDVLSASERLSGKEERGLVNIIDDIVEFSNKYAYRATQCVRPHD